MKVCLLGASLDVGNLGCRALAMSLIKLIVELQPNAQIKLLYGNREPRVHTVHVGDREISVSVINFRMSPRSKLHQHLFWILLMALAYRCLPFAGIRRRFCRAVPWIAAVEEADLVGDICGGDSFSDIYGVGRFVKGAVTTLITILIGKPYVFLPQTYGPFSTSIARGLARFVLFRASAVYARDQDSIDCLRDLLGSKATSANIQFCPDVAFALDPVQPPELQIEPQLEPDQKLLVALNVSGLLYIGGYTMDNMFNLKCDYKSFIRLLLERLLAETDAHVLLIPHGFGDSKESDEQACSLVWQDLKPKDKERVHRLKGQYNQNEIKGVIGRCGIIYGSRMHACIAAISQGIPCVALAYSRKFRGVFDSMGVGEMVLDLREVDEGPLLDECLRRFQDREKSRERLIEKIRTIEKDLRSIFRAGIVERAGITAVVDESSKAESRL